MMNDDFLKANRDLWNARTPIHLDSDFYDVPGFKSGESSLCGIELREMGSVRDKSILHLQCHFGLDTLSLAREGAKVTGVDFSESAIEAARDLASELDISAEFVCCDVLQLAEQLNGQFDIVFTSFGVVGWLPDLSAWGNVIKHFLKPGGFFYLLEFHRQFVQLNANGEIEYDYFGAGHPDVETVSSTYAGDESHDPRQEYWWNHSTSDIVMALLNADLHITLFNEFPHSAFPIQPTMIESGPRQWVLPNLAGKIPYMFSLKAQTAAQA